MSTFAAIVGEGSNGLEIPLLVFANEAEANKYLEESGINQFIGENQWLSEEFSEGEVGRNPDDDDDEPAPIYAKLFKDGNYYAGCGGCYRLHVRTYEFGQPMVGWDLD